MTHFIRNSHNKTIVDLEVFTNEYGDADLSCFIYIDKYSDFLLDNIDIADEIIRTFTRLSELRGFLHEEFKFLYREDEINTELVNELVKINFKPVCDRYGLSYVVD